MFESKYEDIIAAQNGDENKMASLVSKNMGLVYSITKRFQGRGFETEDLNQIGTLGLIKAIKHKRMFNQESVMIKVSEPNITFR